MQPSPAEPNPSTRLPHEEPDGVYFNKRDAPGFFMRVLIAALDLTIITAIMYGLATLLIKVWPKVDRLVFSILMVSILWAYQVALKRSLGTVGYLICRMKIVDLHGNRPGFFKMTLRFLVSTGFNPLVDLIWLNNDDCRQGLRDKLCGTYVIKRSAIPAGRGALVYTNVFLLGMSLIYREVRRKA